MILNLALQVLSLALHDHALVRRPRCLDCTDYPDQRCNQILDGCLVGGRIGPVLVRRSPARLLRVLIGLAGVALAVKLGIDTY